MISESQFLVHFELPALPPRSFDTASEQVRTGLERLGYNVALIQHVERKDSITLTVALANDEQAHAFLSSKVRLIVLEQ
jgi:hypothetical protein